MNRKKINKLLIANRGEIVLRVIRACEQLGITTIAIHATNDKNRLIECAADNYIHIPGKNICSTYLNINKIIKIAKREKADAIHPGYGFLSENPEFAKACEKNKIIFIGPSSTVLRKAADKIEAKNIAKKHGLKVTGGSEILRKSQQATAFAEEHGYPMMIKARGGGGGRGIRLARKKEELLLCLENASREASTSFGIAGIYAEEYISKTKHIEFQFLADSNGSTAVLFDRDCSIQRRFQKLIEEAPSRIPVQLRKTIIGEVRRLVRSIGYEGAGTAEFLLTEEGKMYFLEINPRIQVEHGITEMITGIDIVKEQIRIAQGLPLSFRQEDVRAHGHAIECRIIAESARRSFAPSGGTIMSLSLGGMPGHGLGRIRIDHAAYEGMQIHPEYDSLIAKVMAWGESRKSAIATLDRALSSMRIDGVPNTIDFYRFLIRHKEFRRGKLSTSFISDKELVKKYTEKTLSPERVAIIAAALHEKESNSRLIFKRQSNWTKGWRKEATSSGEED
ncbi:ATP-grasp domain-containing protein [archaeon]|nr:ATP-grasp domain-containing protein [archaeon]